MSRLGPETAEHVGSSVREATGSPLPSRLRPPGALAEAQFLDRCTRCGDCADACPHYAVHTLADWVVPGGGTPVLVPDSRPCHLCTDYPCARACAEGALVAPEGLWKLGHVRLSQARCLPFRGPECGACAGLCPEGVAGLTLKLGRPQIDIEECVGCGRCIEACPTNPPALEHVAPE